MATKKTGSRRKPTATAATYPTSAMTVAARNLLNMAAVAAASATILLCLLMIKKF